MFIYSWVERDGACIPFPYLILILKKYIYKRCVSNYLKTSQREKLQGQFAM